MKTRFIAAESSLISSLRCGGRLERLFAPYVLSDVLRLKEDYPDEKIRIIGGLTNTLVLSHGVKDIVITSENMRGLTVEGSVIKAFAGEKLSNVAKTARTYGLSGMERLSGIPGTVGGAVMGNAGSFGESISDLFIGAETVDLDKGKTEFIPAEEIAFGYRYCNLRKHKDFIYRAWFGLTKGRYETIAALTEKAREDRLSTQPKYPSLGCVFKKYGNESAGWYIEQAGLKGYRYGGMEISDVHANFIVNRGGGTPEEYLYLVKLAERKVYETFGIKLIREIKVLGEQEDNR